MARVLMKGNEAIAEAAVRAGVDAFFGYPITPQNEVPEYLSRELPKRGATYLQSESELAGANMLLGASAAGGRVMTSTSGPGLCLMLEAMSSMALTRLPAVVVDVVRSGPGMGDLAPAQEDWKVSGNGAYKIPILLPGNVQELAEMVYEAFDIADQYWTPVLILADGMLGQMMEPVVMPEPKHALTEEEIPEVKPYALTGHKNKRDRHAINSVWLKQELLENYINEYWPKYEKAEHELQDWESRNLEGAEIVFVAYGSTSRIAMEAMEMLADEGIKVGLIRPKTLWPFPVNAFKEIDFNTTKQIISVELSQGQMIYDVKLAVECKLPVSLINRVGGMLLDPQEIVDRTKKIMEVK